MNNPLIFKINSGDSDIITKSKDSLITSSTINVQESSLGYHNFIHRTKNYMSITKNLEIKNQFYYIVNPYELEIPNYEDSIKNITLKYLNIKDDKIITREFSIVWELLYLFNLANRDVSYFSTKKDSESIDNALKKFKQKLNSGTVKESNKNCSLIFAIDDLNLNNSNFEEQDSYELLLNELHQILDKQAIKGNCVLKVFETYTTVSLKIIYILSSFYEEVYLYKPYLSRLSDTEKYIVCKGFKKDPKLDDKIKSIESVLKKDKNSYIFDIFPELKLPKDFPNNFKFMNIRIANPQQIMINKMVSFIKENNYYGEKFHMYKDQSIEASKWWISMFYPPSNNIFEKNKEEMSKLLEATIIKNNMEESKLSSQLI